MVEASTVVLSGEEKKEFTLEDLPALLAQLKQTITGPTILGSQLGDLLLQTTTALDRSLKLKRFGELRKFSREQLADLVVLKAQHAPGQPEIYDVLLESPSEPSTTSSRVPLPFTLRNARYFWYAISNPQSRYKLATSSGKIICHVKGELPAEATEFASFTLDDYANLAKDFVAHLPTPSRTIGEQLIGQTGASDLHPKFMLFLREECGATYVQKWDATRKKEALKLFAERALQAGISQAQISSYKEILATFDTRSAANKTSHGANAVLPNAGRELTQTQALAIKILFQMSDDQIRQLNFPFGLTLDATKLSVQ